MIDLDEIIEKAKFVSRKLMIKFYGVGGFVRDKIIRKKETEDIDFVVEGNSEIFSRELFLELSGREYKFFPYFGTGSFLCGNFRIDIARARKEEYPIPGGDPKITFVDDIFFDLGRRDFSANAVAYDFFKNDLIDVFDGVKAVEDRILDVLHPLSIQDDPTRILRGVRLSLKLNFDLSEKTLVSLEIAKRRNAFKNVSFHRYLAEIKIAAEEEFFPEFMKKLQDLGVLFLISPQMELEEKDFKYLGTNAKTREQRQRKNIVKLFSIYYRKGFFDLIEKFKLPKVIIEEIGKEVNRFS